jgi:hypothetical protein
MWCSTVDAAEKKATVYEGWISSVPDNTIVFDVPTENGKSQRRIFYVGPETTITINGKPGNHAGLAKGMAIRLTPKTSKIAGTVEAVTPKKKSW